MIVSRRRLLETTGLALLGTGLSGISGLAQAQTVDLLKIFVPANPGGGWDQTGRSMEQALKSAGLIKAAQITNVGGAGGTVGLPQFVNQWKGQGNALMVAGMVMVGAIIANKSANDLTQTTPIARLTGEVQVLVVPASSPFKKLSDLITAFKAEPAKISWAGGSAGGTDHILAGLIARATGVDPKNVAYVAYSGGGPAQAAIIGSQVSCGISGWGEFSEQIKAGKMRALAISADKRQPGIDAPTFKEQGVDVTLYNWRGVFAPPGISAADRQALIDLVGKMAKSPAWQEIVKKYEWSDIYLPGDEYSAFVKAETERIHGVLKDVGLAS